MEKVALPIKTKIAAWLIIFDGLILGFWFCVMISANWSMYYGGINLLLSFVPYLVFLLFLFIGSFLLILKRKKWAWGLTVIAMLPISFFGLSTLSDPDLLLFGVPFILSTTPLCLLLLDRKNFWKIAQ